MKELFIAISDKLQTDVADLRWIDFDLGQLEQENLPPVSFPCALIGLEEAIFEDLSQNGQQAEMIINIRVAFKVFERTHNKVPENFRLVGLAHLDTIDAINTALSGLAAGGASGLKRTSVIQEKRADLRVYTLSYSTLYTDIPESPYVPPETLPGFCIDAQFE